jgi:hypothetical protein
VRYILEISRGRNMNFIFDVAQQAAEDRHITCPSTYMEPRCLQIQLHIFPIKLTYFHISDLSSLEILIWLGSYFVTFEKKPPETVCGPKRREIWEPKKVRSDGIHNLYSSPSITRVLRSRCTRMARKCNTPEGNNKTENWAPTYDVTLRRARATMLEVEKQ